MKNFYIKNVKKTRIKQVDSETASLTGTPRKIKDEFINKKILKKFVLYFICYFYNNFLMFIII